MDKDRLIKLLDDRKMGERTRVLFELLMESIGADYEDQRSDIWLKIKQRIEAEQESIKTFTEIQGFPSKAYEDISKEIEKTPLEQELEREHNRVMQMNGDDPCVT